MPESVMSVKNIREISDVLVERVVLHQEDIRQSAVVATGSSGNQLGFNVVVGIFLNVEFEIWG